MWSFSRNEERLILILLTLLFLGCVVHYFRKTTIYQAREDWVLQQKADERALMAETPPKTVDPDSSRVANVLAVKKRQFLSDKININTATEEELIRLPKIGPALARRIVEYRRQHGPFRSTLELTNVRGIGEKTLSALAERITIE